MSAPSSGSSVPATPLTLPAVNTRSSTLRLLSGRSLIWRSVIVCPGVPDSRLSNAPSEVMFTTVSTAPGSSVTLTVAVTVSTLMLSTTAFLKPCASTVMR